MEITIVRIYFDNMQTIGALQVNGHYFCDTMEPRAINWKKQKKIPGRTAIPECTYPLELSYDSNLRKEVMKVKGIPNFSSVQILGRRDSLRNRGHICIGKWEDDHLAYSKGYVGQLMELVRKAQERGEPITVKVRSRFNWTVK